ncbi:transcriptional regulator, GntR family [Oceaniovalibus guishaninsula JLT2003]|uniref:Transcriptional regulator, GntR family n=1 Tax=Oceaniovalibus guishaninsula JLT2003 TaxID=1231392 RepID=K2I9Z1_9RHOB|nr:GntR family transcriptional regulator [Oceaniovalibus guishaninsula]EKE45795.1 transcriptional regulator, GntR family [Oceaniovalibus guishaninsula JLT2003]
MSDISPPPVWRQIADLVVRQIASGELREGDRLPPERRMAQDHDIAVGTLRRALADLTDRGLIERRQGSGNYVRHARQIGGMYEFFRLELVQGGGRPDAEILDVARLAKPHDAPAFGPAPDAYCIRRLRLLDGIRVAAEEIWLDATHALDPASIQPSLYQTYRRQLGLRIIRTEDRIGIDTMPQWSDIAMKSATCCHVARVSWGQDGQPVEYSRTWFDADLARYVSRIG